MINPRAWIKWIHTNAPSGTAQYVRYMISRLIQERLTSGELTSFEQYNAILHCQTDYQITLRDSAKMRTRLHFCIRAAADPSFMQFEQECITTAFFAGGVATVWNSASWAA